MLRFIKHNLTGIDGVALYPVISLVLFTMLFIVVILYVAKMKKSRIDLFSAIPLDNEEIDPNINIKK